MIENPYYSPEFHGDYEIVSVGQLDLEEGGTIPRLPAGVHHVGAS